MFIVFLRCGQGLRCHAYDAALALTDTEARADLIKTHIAQRMKQTMSCGQCNALRSFMIHSFGMHNVL